MVGFPHAGSQHRPFLILHCSAHLVSFILYILSFPRLRPPFSQEGHTCSVTYVLGLLMSLLTAIVSFCASFQIFSIRVFDSTQRPRNFWKVVDSLEQRLSRYLRVSRRFLDLLLIMPTGNWLANPSNFPNNSSQINALAFMCFYFWRPRVLFSSPVPYFGLVLDPVVCWTCLKIPTEIF